MKELIERIRLLISNKKIGILGFGLEGQSTLRFLREHFGDIPLVVADWDAEIAGRTGLDLSSGNVRWCTGVDYLDKIGDTEVLFKSPGIGLPHNFLEKNPGMQVVTQTGLMMAGYRRQVIGVTGTKGKSTTSSLIHHILTSAGLKNVLIGNIGVPPFDSLHMIGDDTVIVYELSSHQLEDIRQSPHISVMLNLFPEHLDRYPSKEHYFRAKWNIFQHREPEDVLILFDDIPLHDLPGEEVLNRGKLLRYGLRPPEGKGAYLEGGKVMVQSEGKARECCNLNEGLPLKGRHNRLNTLAAILACHEAGISLHHIMDSIRTFKGLEHRLEFVGCYGGIDFYNDSIATIPEATLEAIRAIPGIATIILGGFDRNLDYTGLMNVLMESGIKNLIFMGRAGERMYQLALGHPEHQRHQLFQVKNLEEAFEVIPEETPRGSSCLLSPAAASYDIFKNFEERGHQFKKIARTL